MRNILRKNFLLTIFFIYQFFSTLLIVLGVWPRETIFLNLAVELTLVILLDPEYGLLSIILSLPFYLALPLAGRDSFESWRLVIAIYFLVFLFKKQILLWGSGLKFKRENLHFYKWDKYLLWFLLAALLSALIGPAVGLGIKKVIFVANIYLLYLAGYNVWQSVEQRKRAIIAGFVSTATIVIIGYLQLAATFATTIYYFWQYWATLVSRTYYGSALYNTLIYSNSWFIFGQGQPSLRMFSVMPDSHSFAVVALISIAFAVTLLRFVSVKWQKVLLWFYIGLADLAIIFSGTKGVWVGFAAAFFLAVIFVAHRYGRKILLPSVVAGAIFVILFATSPLIQKGLNSIHKSGESANLIARAENIYSLDDSSNAGRIFIWKTVLQFSSSHFLTGAGYGNFAAVVRPEAEIIKKNFNLPIEDITAHNLYLGFLAETGVIGLIIILLYFKDILMEFAKYFKRHYLYSEDPEAQFAVTYGLFLVALLVYSLVDETLYNDRVLMLFFLGLALAASIFRSSGKDNK